MRYHNITKDDMLNGEGLRVVVWLAGCEHVCPGCHNPETWDVHGGIEFDQAAKEELFDSLDEDYIAGVTFSGGDPLHPKNREKVGELIKEIHERFPQKTIWMYTGYEFDEVSSLDFFPLIDVLIDGKFIEDLKDEQAKWRGSSNQKVIDVKSSLKLARIVLHNI